MVPTGWDTILKAGAVFTLAFGTLGKVAAFFSDSRNARRYKQERDDLRDQITGMIEDRKRAKEWEDSLTASGAGSPPRRRPSTKTLFEEQFVSDKSSAKPISRRARAISSKRSSPRKPGSGASNDPHP